MEDADIDHAVDAAVTTRFTNCGQFCTCNERMYAHNDEVAIGAIQALEAAGRKPDVDVLVVGIDRTRDALQTIIDGKMGVTVESSPFFGPLACDTMKKYAAGEVIAPWVQVEDRIFTKENAAENLAGAY